MSGGNPQGRDLDAILSALAQRGEEEPRALFKRHGELAMRKFAGKPLTPAEEVELEAVRCALDASELLQLWDGQRERAERAEVSRDAYREAMHAFWKLCKHTPECLTKPVRCTADCTCGYAAAIDLAAKAKGARP